VISGGIEVALCLEMALWGTFNTLGLKVQNSSPKELTLTCLVTKTGHGQDRNLRTEDFAY
jgi:hypothetical protein